MSSTPSRVFCYPKVAPVTGRRRAEAIGAMPDRNWRASSQRDLVAASLLRCPPKR